ncbi:high-affinity Zn(2+) transporter zrt1 [Conoideocrella luteorostrata]|uniref:High-affinity Zn(2+) transporter zrt1 n=1 Tax=Conoideocrella luteorostrata TaxID=1105319 RepID=A0AAJ0CIM6_9HYPO|nr:high-affinity Zn(2+) transporter zrt1 [Conoideocrella luteorostrata]
MYLWTLASFVLAGVATAELFPRQTPAPTTTGAALPTFTAITSCHLHETALYCVDKAGEDVQIIIPGAGGGKTEGGGSGSGSGNSNGNGNGEKTGSGNGHQHCHFHAGVEHCVGAGESEGKPSCGVTNRDYNIGLRVGLLFVIMATSALGVFGPIFLQKVLPEKLSLIFIILKQFGTGIIISTAFVHLFTHASLMFGNKCLGELKYEATTAAIMMAGIFLSFLVEYIGQRIVLAKTRASSQLNAEEKAKALLSTEVVSILVMEAGILFHSLLIGLTLVVAGDSFFITLFVVILFHQMFEGLALGTRIATIGTTADVRTLPSSGLRSNSTDNGNDTDKSVHTPTEETVDDSTLKQPLTLSMKKKLGLAALFAFVTPIGMAIGIGVLKKFNGNDPSTIVAIGTLDALSAGILVWTGVVEMWAADWMTGSHGHKAELAEANMLTVTLGGLGLVTGMAVMSLLGKWA